MRAVCSDFKQVKLESEKLKIGFTVSMDEIETDERIKQLNEQVFSQLKEIQSQTQKFIPKIDVNEIQLAYKNLAVASENQSETYQKSMKILEKNRKIMDNVFQDIDIWILPCSNVLPYEHNFNHDPIKLQHKIGEIKYWKSQSYTSMLSLLGCPIVVIPVGMINGLPVGVQVVGKRNEDELLLERCKILEKIFINNVKEPNFQQLIDSKL
jgi:hypothetical protein